jgi:hypothetical protein
VSRHSTELAELGLIRERPVRRPRPAIGRPHVPVDIDTRSHLVGGIHIALRHTTLVLMDLRGRVLADAGDRMAAFPDGHLCGRRPLGVGPASGAAGTGLLPAAPFPDVLAALEADEPWALAPFGERARLVGRAVALPLDVINPEILVVAEAGDRAQARTARFARRGGGARTRGRRSAAHRGGEFVRNTNARRGGGIDRVARGICAPIETRAATCEHVIS